MKGTTGTIKLGINIASEILALFFLARDFLDMRARLVRVVIGKSRSGEHINADDRHIAVAVIVLMK